MYDRVYSGFFNDLEDIQEIIFVLSGYGGTNLAEFLGDLKKFKTVNLDEDEGKPGLSTLTIDIPVEAREKMLEYRYGEFIDKKYWDDLMFIVEYLETGRANTLMQAIELFEEDNGDEDGEI